jgi:Spy/CpxP family protein refolding chaperone
VTQLSIIQTILVAGLSLKAKSCLSTCWRRHQQTKKNKSTPMGDHNHFDGIRLAAAQRQEISRMRPPYWLMRQKIEPMGITLPMSQGR